jgi:hypothetical protein
MKIVKLTVVANATQRNVQGNKNWVAVKKINGEVILEATTLMNGIRSFGPETKVNQYLVSRTVASCHLLKAGVFIAKRLWEV